MTLSHVSIQKVLRRFSTKPAIVYLIDGRDKQVFAKHLWVPQTMQILILANLHGSTLGGHWGLEITVQNILTSYFWPRLASDAETFIRRYPDC